MSASSLVVPGQTYWMSKLKRLQDSNWSSYKRADSEHPDAVITHCYFLIETYLQRAERAEG